MWTCLIIVLCRFFLIMRIWALLNEHAESRGLLCEHTQYWSLCLSAWSCKCILPPVTIKWNLWWKKQTKQNTMFKIRLKPDTEKVPVTGSVTTQHSTTQRNATQHNAMQHNTTQHNTAQHSTTQQSTTQHSTTQHSTTQHSTAQHNITQHNATQHNTAEHGTTQHNTAQHNTTQHNTTQHNTTPDNTTQHRTELIVCTLNC